MDWNWAGGQLNGGNCRRRSPVFDSLYVESGVHRLYFNDGKSFGVCKHQFRAPCVANFTECKRERRALYFNFNNFRVAYFAHDVRHGPQQYYAVSRADGYQGGHIHRSRQRDSYIHIDGAVMRTRIFTCVILMVAICVICPSKGTAQALGLAPAQVVKTFKPGVPFQFELATVNNGDNPVEMSVQITDFWYNDANEKVFSNPGTSPHSAANWIQFVPERFHVGSHGTQTMKAIVTPPLDARGGYYAVLFVQSKPQLSFDQSKDGKTVFTNMRLGCLVLLMAEKSEQYKVELTNVKLTPPSANQGLEVTFDVANESNVHIFPLPRVAILDSNHGLVAKAENTAKRYLPGQKDSMHVSWAGNLPAGSYTAVLTVSYGEDQIQTRQLPFEILSQ